MAQSLNGKPPGQRDTGTHGSSYDRPPELDSSSSNSLERYSPRDPCATSELSGSTSGFGAAHQAFRSGHRTFDARGEKLSRGSGFFIDVDRIVTNRHVIEGAIAPKSTSTRVTLIKSGVSRRLMPKAIWCC